MVVDALKRSKDWIAHVTDSYVTMDFARLCMAVPVSYSQRFKLPVPPTCIFVGRSDRSGAGVGV